MPASVRLLSLPLVLAALVLCGFTFAATASATPGDIGYTDQGYSIGGSTTGSKPQSKLWYNDGLWWASQFDDASGEHRIFRLNTATGVWSATATTLDARDSTRSDTLWSAANGKLYVASHAFTESPTTTTAGNAGRVYRYSYNAATDAYSLDAGFPVTINAAKTETLVIDRDTTGTLWATWAVGSKIYVNHTVGGNDATWGTPYVVPGIGSSVGSDDISSLIAFAGKIGVFWSNQADGKVYFSVHSDGAGDGAWATEVVPTGYSPDDHINLKTDGSGRVFAAIKTSESTKANPLTMLMTRSSSGTWKAATFGTVSNSHTRPIVELDVTNDVIHMLATCPQPPATSGQSGGDICEKTAPIGDNPVFPTGIGTAVIRDVDSAELNDATSTKQNVTAAMGLVVSANNPETNVYWHAQISLGGSNPGPSAPVAAFTATPQTGTAPLDVQFTDTSTGAPFTSRTWDFGDGATSTEANPLHTYAAAGTYTVTLTVVNAGGTSTATKSISVTPNGGGTGGGTKTFTPAGDAYVKSTSPTSKYGLTSGLRVRLGTSSSPGDYRSLLKFSLDGLTGPVTGAKLRLWVTDNSPDGGSVYKVSNSWDETTVTWNTAPALAGSPIGTIGATTAAGTWTEVTLDPSAFSAGNADYTLNIANASTNSAYYDSREGTHKPELVLTTSGGGTPGPAAPVAGFSATPQSGTAPLDVQFTDTSTGAPFTSRTWDFGDGATSTDVNPVHSYAAAGSYTATLTVSNATGTNATSRTITVSPAGGGGGLTATFNPSADAYVKSTSPSSKYGTQSGLRVRLGTSSSPGDYRSLLKFDVSNLTGPVASVKLRLWVTDASPVGGSVYSVSNNWFEPTVTWANAPALAGPVIGTIGATSAAGTWTEVTLSPSAFSAENGTYTLDIVSSSSNSAYYDSREGTHKPELVLTTS